MFLYYKAILLFLLNIFDAFLTMYWVRHGYATEGNHLMASLLEMGNLPFFLVKLAVGIIATYCFWNWQEFKLARYGLSLALVMYSLVMGVHVLTGLTAAGLISHSTIHDIAVWSQQFFITAFI